MQFEDMIGGTHKFYGVDNNCFKIGFHTFEAVEDPDDGWRSFMKCVEIKIDRELIFFGHSLATVRIDRLDHPDVEIYTLIDVDDGHLWLAFGTNQTDEWYPYFMFDYYPKPPK